MKVTFIHPAFGLKYSFQTPLPFENQRYLERWVGVLASAVAWIMLLWIELSLPFVNRDGAMMTASSVFEELGTPKKVSAGPRILRIIHIHRHCFFDTYLGGNRSQEGRNMNRNH
jgi:hypothetical protein